MAREYTLYELRIIQYTRKLRIPILQNPMLYLVLLKHAKEKGQRIANAIISNFRYYRDITRSYIATFILSSLDERNHSDSHVNASNAATAYFGGQITNEEWFDMRRNINVIITVIEDTFVEIGLNPM